MATNSSSVFQLCDRLHVFEKTRTRVSVDVRCLHFGGPLPSLETPGIVSNYGSFQHVVAPGKEHVIGHTDWSSCERKNAQDWFRCQSLPREPRRRAEPWSPTRPPPGPARQQGNPYVFSQKRGIDLQTAIINRCGGSHKRECQPRPDLSLSLAGLSGASCHSLVRM